MGTSSWARTAIPALFGYVLFISATAPGCDPCERGAWTGLNSCTDCDAMPERPTPTGTRTAACDKSRFVVKDPEGACVHVRGDDGVLWLGSPLFAGAKGELATYCRYEWNVPETAPETGKLPPGLAASEDCTFVTPQSDSFTGWAGDRFLDAAIGPSEPRAPVSDGVSVRVSVLDTSPFAPGGDPIQCGRKSAHGETLARSIRTIACTDEARCPVDVRTRLVMPRWVDVQGNARIAQSSPRGGQMGLLSDVTEGMWEEMEAYRQEIALGGEIDPNGGTNAVSANVPVHWVLNESYAWGQFGGPAPCDDDPAHSTSVDVQALFAAYEAAACLGAVHVAAAGNHTGGLATSVGLLCGARWDKAVHPDLARCEALWGADEYHSIQASFANLLANRGEADRPLFDAGGDALVSVGATDFDRHAIALTRPASCPEVAAVGIGGTARIPAHHPSSECAGGEEEGGYFPFLFGTSVAASVVSGRLGGQWATDPSAGPSAAVVTLSDTELLASMNRRGGCGCEAEEAVCERPFVGAAEGLSPGSQNPQPPQDVRASVSAPTLTFASVGSDPAAVCLSRVPQCAAESAAAAEQVFPTPGEPPCLRCKLESPLGDQGRPALRVDKNPEFDAVQRGVSAVVLVVEDAQGNVTLTQKMDLSAFLQAGGASSETPLDTSIELHGARAWISVYDVDGTSTSQQIFVVE